MVQKGEPGGSPFLFILAVSSAELRQTCCTTFASDAHRMSGVISK